MTEPASTDRLQSLPDAELLARIRAGDALAEREVFDRYYTRTVGFARARMNPRLQVRVGASDVAASAMKSVLMGVRPGEFDLDADDTLWPLLATVTLNKIRNQWKTHTAQRKDLRLSQPLDPCAWLLEVCPPQACEAEMKDLVDCLLGQFSPRRQKILRLAMDGYGVGEIAAMVGVSERTVYETRREAARCLMRLLESVEQ
jgi:DNA-directed RNA polymerase specialized sigma24 family protein